MGMRQNVLDLLALLAIVAMFYILLRPGSQILVFVEAVTNTAVAVIRRAVDLAEPATATGSVSGAAAGGIGR